MASKTGTGQTAVPAMNLQRTFENAVRDIYQTGLTGQISYHRTPIVQRRVNGPAVSSDGAKKQALSDAAKALAQLWKVVPNSSR
jgi:hypothetical protein